MSRLNETSEGWQWDDGPIFPERDLAIEYSQYIIRKEIKKEIEHLEEVLWHLNVSLELLEKEAEKRRNKT
jgi:hypothetical protein